MKAVALVGSLREGSFNRQLIETMQERYAEQFDIDIADIGALPHYNEDFEESPDEAVQVFKRQVEGAQAIFIATPEFNWSIPGVLKNAIDWLSRVERPITGKPVMPMGVSNGMLGTVRAQQHLRQILASMGVQAKVLPPAGNEIYISAASQKFKDGRLKDEDTLLLLDKVVKRFAAFVEETK